MRLMILERENWIALQRKGVPTEFEAALHTLLVPNHCINT